MGNAISATNKKKEEVNRLLNELDLEIYSFVTSSGHPSKITAIAKLKEIKEIFYENKELQRIYSDLISELNQSIALMGVRVRHRQTIVILSIFKRRY